MQDNQSIETSIKNASWFKKLEVLRNLRGWSQTETADKCGTTQKNYWLWETGQAYPRKRSQKAIASVFGVSVNELFPEVDVKKAV